MYNYEKSTNKSWGNRYKGLSYGIVYGLIAKVIFCSGFSAGTLTPVFGITTLSFLVLVPFVMGLIVAWYPNTAKTTVLKALFAVAGLLAIVILLQESLLYVLIVLPAYTLMTIAGSLAGRYLWAAKKRKLLLLTGILAPFLIAPLERHLGAKEIIYAQSTTININASEDSIWQHIVKVEAPEKEEDKATPFPTSGFPQPIKAVFDTVTTGGSRKAIFDRGLIFTETITAVEPGKTLAFTIQADPGSKPLTELEKRVIVDGKYFEVLNGKYELEKINDRQIKLHLTATYRISTHFNVYCGWWANLIMDRIQKRILQIVKENSETKNPEQ